MMTLSNLAARLGDYKITGQGLFAVVCISTHNITLCATEADAIATKEKLCCPACRNKSGIAHKGVRLLPEPKFKELGYAE